MMVGGGASGNGYQQLRASVNIFRAWGVDVCSIDIFRNWLAAGIDVSGGRRAEDFLNALGTKVAVHGRRGVDAGQAIGTVISVSGGGVMGHIACVVISIAGVGDLVSGRIDHQSGLANRKAGGPRPACSG